MRHIFTMTQNAGSGASKEKNYRLIIESCPALAKDDVVDPISIDDLSGPAIDLVKKIVRRPPGLSTILSRAIKKGIDQLKNLPVSKISYIDNEGKEQFKIITKFI